MKIIIKGEKGNIAIMYPVEGADVAEAVSKFKESHPNENYGDYFEYEGELPAERQFRDAWTVKNNKIVIDDVKAMSIHLDRIRSVRNEELDRLDKEQLRWLSDPWKPKAIDEQKQILRDLPETINNLDWPDILPRN